VTGLCSAGLKNGNTMKTTTKRAQTEYSLVLWLRSVSAFCLVMLAAAPPKKSPSRRYDAKGHLLASGGLHVIGSLSQLVTHELTSSAPRPPHCFTNVLRAG